jgi:transposase
MVALAEQPKPPRAVKWTELSGQERYQVLAMARKGEIEVSQLCKTFGVSRQTLYRALEATEEASIAALEPKKRGRKPTPLSELQAKQLTRSNASLQKELDRWKMKYDIAKTFIDLQRELERDDLVPGGREKKRRRRRKKKR